MATPITGRVQSAQLTAIMGTLPPPTAEEITAFRAALNAKTRYMDWLLGNKGMQVPNNIEQQYEDAMDKQAPFDTVIQQRLEKLRPVITAISNTHFQQETKGENALLFYYNSQNPPLGGKRSIHKSKRKTRRRKH